MTAAEAYAEEVRSGGAGGKENGGADSAVAMKIARVFSGWEELGSGW